jgi:carotenoid cleavage dioxygenase-like enzyme
MRQSASNLYGGPQAMAKFPNSPSYTGFHAPSRLEADIKDLEVEGEVPRDINGAFYRVAPDPQLPPRLGDDIWFNGDGMVSMFRFHDGRIDFKQRRARTDKVVLEERAGRALFGAYRNPLTDDPSVEGRYRGTANTNVIMYGGQLLALKEDSPALAMDPVTLETRGYTDFHGQVKSPTFTAHPKIDPRTGDMCAFAYAAKGLLTRDMVYYELNSQNKLEREVWFEIPYYCMMHDFGVTEDYAVFHVIPIVSSWERLEAGLPHFGFDTTKDIYLGVLPRKGEARDMRWFKAPNCFASHVMNAFNEGTKVHIDVPQAKGNMFPFFPDVHGAPFNPQNSLSYMTRWTVDMDSRGDAFESMTRLTQVSGEFPRIDERYATGEYRYGFLLSQDFSRPLELPGPDLVVRSHHHHPGALFHSQARQSARGRRLPGGPGQSAGRKSDRFPHFRRRAPGSRSHRHGEARHPPAGRVAWQLDPRGPTSTNGKLT